jgi:hypothetical protein
MSAVFEVLIVGEIAAAVPGWDVSIVGVANASARTLDQVEDVLATIDVRLSAEQMTRLNEVSRIDFGFPYDLLAGPQGQMVYGVLEPRIDLPPRVPYRRRDLMTPTP